MSNDLERIGDDGEKIAILMQRQADGAYKFSQEANRDLQAMADKAGEVLTAMRVLILHREEDPLPAARVRENALNKLRDDFRSSHLKRLLEGKCSALSGILYMDILTSFEKMGDHAFNVVEACVGIK